jgi:hypothetical protein
MEKALNHTEDVNFPEVVRKGSMSHIGEGELKVKTYEEYLIRFTRSPDYYVEPLLEFLDIKGERKQKLLEMNKRRVFEGSLSINELEPSISATQKKFFTAEFTDKGFRLVIRDNLIIEEIKTAKQIEELHSRMIRELKVKKDMLN